MSAPLFGIAMTLLIAFSYSSDPNEQTRRALIPGNISIGGLFTMMLPDDGKECSVVSSDVGIEALEALLFSVDRINQDDSLLPNITLGVKAFDSCGSANLAMEQAIKEFVLGDAWKARGKSCVDFGRPVMGVVGPRYSYEAEKITPFFNLFKIPLISHSATSPTLSNKGKYNYFSRTMAADTLQAEAMVDLLDHFGWRHFSILYSDESYGSSAFKLIQDKATEKGMCLINEGMFPKKYSRSIYATVVESVLSDQKINVIVVYCLHVPNVVRLIVEQAGDRELLLIGPVTVGNALSILHSSTTHGLFFHEVSPTNKEFNEYFFNLSPLSNTRNPWFKDFFENVANCSFELTRNKKACRLNDTLQSANYSIFMDKMTRMPPVVDAVYAFAHALTGIQKSRCTNASSNRCLPPDEVPGKELLEAIRSLSFQSPSGRQVTFTSQGDIIGTYDVYYVGEIGRQRYTNHKVGEWREGKLDIFSSTWRTNFVALESDCSEICHDNQIRQNSYGKPECCWVCEDCPRDTVPINATICKACPKGYKPDKDLKKCLRIHAKFYSLDGRSVSIYLALTPIIISLCGILLLLVVAVVFIKFRKTPLVKASSRELSSLLFLGIFLSYLFPFVSVAKPSRLGCFWEVILDSLPTTMCYVAIVVKSDRVYRIFNAKLVFKTTLLHAKPQILISIGLISFQAFLLLALKIKDPPRDQLTYPSPTEVYHECVSPLTHSLVSHSYNVLLIIIATYYAYKTRNLPGNFNEAKYIAFAVYSSCVTMAAFTIITLITSKKLSVIGITAVSCFRIPILATILLVSFFLPKVYVILRKPERNVAHKMETQAPATTLGSSDGKVRPHDKATDGSEANDMELKKVTSTSTISTQTELLG